MSEAWLSEDYHPLLELHPQTSRSEDQRIKHKATAIFSMKSFSALNFKKKTMNVYKQNDKAYFQLTYILRPRSFAEDIFVKIRLWSYPTAIYHGDSPYTLRPRDQTAFMASVWGFVLKIISTEKSRCESIFHGYNCRNANEVFVSVLFSQFWSPRKSNLPIKLWMSSCSF